MPHPASAAASPTSLIEGEAVCLNNKESEDAALESNSRSTCANNARGFFGQHSYRTAAHIRLGIGTRVRPLRPGLDNALDDFSERRHAAGSQADVFANKTPQRQLQRKP